MSVSSASQLCQLAHLPANGREDSPKVRERSGESGIAMDTWTPEKRAEFLERLADGRALPAVPNLIGALRDRCGSVTEPIPNRYGTRLDFDAAAAAHRRVWSAAAVTTLELA